MLGAAIGAGSPSIAGTARSGGVSKHDLSRTGGPWRQRGGFAFVCLIASLSLLPSQALAETLFEALENAYLINPTINAERARLRATDEDVARAMSGFRPTISGSGHTDFLHDRTTRKSTVLGPCQPGNFNPINGKALRDNPGLINPLFPGGNGT